MSGPCQRCHGDRFVKSRFRPYDYPALLLLLRPVRCQSCFKRRYRNLVPIVGGLFRLSISVAVLVLVGGMAYVNLTDSKWEPLQVLKIDFRPDFDSKISKKP